MKWNCNIVKDMYNRVNRRKFGLLCIDDTSNEDFIKSYLNRLDCKPINLSCLKGSNLPCTTDEASNTIICNTIVIINVNTKIVNGEVQYTFTAVTTGATPPVNYAWTWNNTTVWDYVSGPITPGTYYLNGNVLVLKPKQLSGTVSSIVSVNIKDANGCENDIGIDVVYNGGCTDSEAVNYDPTATFDNGSCYYNPLLVSVAYECGENDEGAVGNLCIEATGGNPPYTVVGVPNGTILLNGGNLCQILPNGTNYSFYVIDSLGAVTTLQNSTINCPFDCETVTILSNFEVECLTDILGNNTGEAVLTLTPSGGNGPYLVTGSINGNPYGPFQVIIPGVKFGPGQTLNNGDVIDVIITDLNGCTTTDSITIDCPLPNPGGGSGFTCEQLQELNISANMLIVDKTSTLVYTDFKYILSYQFTNLSSFGLTIANIASIQYTVTPIVSSGFLAHFLTSSPGFPCLVCTGSLIPVFNPGTVPQYVDPNPYALANTQFVARYLGGCVGTKTIESTLKLQITVVTEDTSCVLCFEKTLEADWNCVSETSISSGKIMNNVIC